MRKFAANVMILGIDVVDGGEERADSIQNALARVKPDIDFVAVHDAARPCIADEWIDRVFEAAEKTDAAILAIAGRGDAQASRPTADRSKKPSPRANLWEAQTPQVFRRQLLLDAYAKRGGFQPPTTRNSSNGWAQGDRRRPARRST